MKKFNEKFVNKKAEEIVSKYIRDIQVSRCWNTMSYLLLTDGGTLEEALSSDGWLRAELLAEIKISISNKETEELIKPEQ